MKRLDVEVMAYFRAIAEPRASAAGAKSRCCGLTIVRWTCKLRTSAAKAS
jgi:hypothetical protein